MYGVKRLNSLFTAAAVSRKRFFRGSPLVGSTQPSPAAIYERKVLPPELSRNVLKLRRESSGDGGVCDVYVVGTRHDSKVASWTPISEFSVANDEAVKYGGRVILGDRPIQITFRRTWAKMTCWDMMKLLFLPLYMPIPDVLPKTLIKMWLEEVDVDMIARLIQELSKHIPTIVETMIHERDQYMSATLLKVAREHTSVVAVVGLGHLPGIQKKWKQPIEVEQLLSIPSAKNTKLKGITIGVASFLPFISSSRNSLLIFLS